MYIEISEILRRELSPLDSVLEGSSDWVLEIVEVGPGPAVEVGPDSVVSVQCSDCAPSPIHAA